MELHIISVEEGPGCDDPKCEHCRIGRLIAAGPPKDPEERKRVLAEIVSHARALERDAWEQLLKAKLERLLNDTKPAPKRDGNPSLN